MKIREMIIKMAITWKNAQKEKMHRKKQREGRGGERVRKVNFPFKAHMMTAST